jgi:hypothetical protein
MLRNRTACLACTVVACLLAAGCSQTDEPAFEPTSPVVRWADLVSSEVALPEDGFTLLVTQPTKGLFPASLGVARLAAVTPESAESGEPLTSRIILAEEPAHDFLRWNSAFDDVRPVREVFPISWIALNGREVTAANVVDACRAMTGRMCLVYCQTDVSVSESEARGVMYEAVTGRPLATIHARGVYVAPESDEAAPEDGDDASRDGPPLTPRLVSEDRFEALVRACMLQLAANDQPQPPAPEEGWVPEGPLAPPVWPPSASPPWTAPSNPYSE